MKKLSKLVGLLCVFATMLGCSQHVAGDADVPDAGDERESITSIYRTIDNVIPEKLEFKKDVFDEESNYQYLSEVFLPYKNILPSVGDVVTFKWKFTSDIDISNLTINLADKSEIYEKGFKYLSEEFSNVVVSNGENFIDVSIPIKWRPTENVVLDIKYPKQNVDKIATFTTISSEISLNPEEVQFIPVGKDDVENNETTQLSCFATNEGISFKGNLLSNIVDQNAICEIRITDIDNDITLYKSYSVHYDTYESWEVVYPLVENEKEYNFEVVVANQESIICKKKFRVKAIGGLGEYKVLNTDYVVSLDSNKVLSRTAQKFSENSNVLVLDYGTQYQFTSIADNATSCWADGGIWLAGLSSWDSKTGQKCDLTKINEFPEMSWRNFDFIDAALKGRSLGVESWTKIKIAGYTYNNTVYFKLNDYKHDTIINWDDETESAKCLLVYKNPETGKYFNDVPETNVYYIKEELDTKGNVVFVNKGTAGAIEVYGKLINYGEKINEPIYIPKFEIFDFIGSWTANGNAIPCLAPGPNDCTLVVIEPKYNVSTDSDFPKNIIYEDDIVMKKNFYEIDDEMYFNFQSSIECLRTVKLVKGNKVTVNFKATLSCPVENIWADIVDTTAAANWWCLLNEEKLNILNGESSNIDTSVTFNIGTDATDVGAAKLVIAEVSGLEDLDEIKLTNVKIEISIE